MKTMARLGLLAAIAVATSLLISCAPKAVSITDRISDFVSSLNGDCSDTYTNLDPSIPMYNIGKVPSVWTAALFPPGNKPYLFTPDPPVTSDPSAVDVTINGTGYSIQYRFVMVDIGTLSENWVIHGLQLFPGPTPIF